MNCEKCNGKTRVIESRTINNVVLRARKCVDCDHYMYTNEYICENVMQARVALNKARLERKHKEDV